MGAKIIFYHDDLQIEIIDVFHIMRTKTKYRTPKRPFHILTKRINGYTDMTFGSESFRITTNNLLYIPANTEYVRHGDGDEEIIAIHFNIANKEFFTPLSINIDEEKCNKAFEEIYRLWNEKKKGFKYKSAAVLYEYLSTIILDEHKSNEYDKLKESINYIENNLTQKLTISNLAKTCALCETQFRKLFKKEYGVSPVKYINRLRVNKAISMLYSGHYSMGEIAEQCGFSTQKYFNKIFYSEIGKSPSQYKNEYFFDNKRP